MTDYGVNRTVAVLQGVIGVLFVAFFSVCPVQSTLAVTPDLEILTGSSVTLIGISWSDVAYSNSQLTV